MIEELITKKDLMKLLGISAGTAYLWQKKRLLKPVSIASKIYYKNHDINELINKSYDGE
jgi:predicted site-specific integrase-resolvase|tara:strand:+ start:296 stop:472 length:177 start_codon:yes stop_codon:yes gene_type:complete